MSRLNSPVVFEQKLRNIEEATPFTLSKDVLFSLPIPIVDANVVGDNNTTKGVVVKCDNNGALLGKFSHWSYDDYDFYNISQGESEGIVERDFGRVVPYLYVLHMGGTVDCLVHLVTPTGGIVYQVPWLGAVGIRLNRQKIYIQMIGGLVLPGGNYFLFAMK